MSEGLTTERPWKIYTYEWASPDPDTYPKNIIESPTGESIAIIEGGWPQCTLAENEANAELIVTAVNAYDALLAIARAARNMQCVPHLDDPDCIGCRTREAARKVLTPKEGEAK